MLSIENGVIIREITVRKPSVSSVGFIIRTQASRPNRLIQAEWKNGNGKTIVSTTLVPNKHRTTEEVRDLSNAIGGVTQLTVQEILPIII